MKKFLTALQAMAFLADKSAHDDSAENTARHFIGNFKKAFEKMTVSKNGLITVKLKTAYEYDECILRFHNSRFQGDAYCVQSSLKSGATHVRGYLDFQYDWPNVYEVLKTFSTT